MSTNTMPTKTKEKTINIPVNGLTCLHPSKRNPDKMVCEIDIDLFEQVNDPGTLDTIIRNARQDYKTGNFKTADSAEDLISDLRGKYED